MAGIDAVKTLDSLGIDRRPTEGFLRAGFVLLEQPGRAIKFGFRLPPSAVRGRGCYL